MKRKLSLLLAVVMILGSFSFAFADDAVKPADFLEDEGILLGDTEGNLNLDKPLERRDSVVLLSRLLGVEEEAKDFTEEGLPTWKDNNDKYYNGFLAWAQSNKYFQGHSEEKFGPRDNITVKEYAVVLLRALGYVDEAADWDKVFDTAKKLGLLEGIEAEADDEVLRGQMADMTFIALGTKMKGSDKTLAEELGIEMPAPAELELVEVKTENLKEIVVKLNNAKLVDEEKLTDANNYRIAGFTVGRVFVDGNDVIVQLDEDSKAFVKGREYELVIRNINKAINGKHEFEAYDNASPEVVDVEVLGEYGIKVTVSEPVKGVRERDFLIDGKNIAMDVEEYGRVLILTPYHNRQFPADAETLTIKTLEDYAGYKAALEDFDIEIVKDDVAPEVVDVVLKGKTVEVTFDKDIYKKSVEAYESRREPGNISYQSGRHDIYTVEDGAEKVDANKVVYSFDDDLPRRAEVTIVGVQNHSKVEMEKTTAEVREVKDDTEPEIIDVDIDTTAKNLNAEDSEAEITLYFDKDVTGKFLENKKEGFDVESHFTLYVDEVLNRNKRDGKVTSAKYDTDKDGKDIEDVIVVTIKGLGINHKDNEFKYDYILEIEDFEDKSGNRMYRDYVDFEVEEAGKDFKIAVDGKTGKPEIKVSEKDEEISIEFTKPVDRIIAENGANYIFVTSKDKVKDLDDLDGEAIVESDGYVVTLAIPELEEEDYKTLEILQNLKDKDDKRIKGPRVYNFVTGELVDVKVDEPEEVSAITYSNNNKAVTKLELNTADATEDKTVVVKHTDAKATVVATGRYIIEDAEGNAIHMDDLAVSGTITDGVTTFTAINLDAVPAGKEVAKNVGEYTLKVIIGDETSTLPIVVKNGDVTGTISAFGYDLLALDNANKVKLPYGKKMENVTVADLDVKVAKTAKAEVEVKAGFVFITVTPEIGAPKIYTMALEETDILTTGIDVTEPNDGDIKLSVKLLDENNKPVVGLTKANFAVKTGVAGAVDTELDIKEINGLTDGSYVITLDKALVKGATSNVIVVSVDTVDSAEISFN